MRSIQRIGVVGAGRMGAGIAGVAAAAGLDCSVVDVDEGRLAAGRRALDGSIARLIAKGRISEADGRRAEGIRWTTRLADLGDREFAVEAVTEDERVKRDIFVALDGICPAGTILASNTSSISITRLASATGRPERCIGMHFMNPVALMELVEIVRGAATSEATVEATAALARRLGKTTTTAADSPGFIANRILMPMINEAFFALQEGVGTAEDIDRTMTLGARHPAGPLALADHIGLDVCLAILEVMRADLGDPKYRPCPLLRRYVDAGWLGKKAGRGVYLYPGERT